MTASLQENFQYYLDHQKELVEKYNGRVVVIMDLQVIGDYADQISAVEASEARGLERGTFLVQKVEPGTAAYTQTFHSRVAFS
nr:hypothetical protein [Variovorax paradoxus]